MTDDAPERKQPKNPLGPTGDRVMANIKRLRQAQGLTYKELSERLGSFGRPIPVLGLSRLERGERRVDVDDLVALAVAFGVAPNRLLLPEVDITTVEHEYLLTPEVTATQAELWSWATGEVPLGCTPASAQKDRRERADEVIFFRSERPQHWEPLAPRAGAPVEPRGTPRSYPAAIRYMILMGLRSGMDTARIRMLVETSFAAGLLAVDAAALDALLAEYHDELFGRPAEQSPQADNGAHGADFPIPDEGGA